MSHFDINSWVIDETKIWSKFLSQIFSLSALREKIDLNSCYLWHHMYTSLFNIYSDGLLNNWCKILLK